MAAYGLSKAEQQEIKRRRLLLLLYLLRSPFFDRVANRPLRAVKVRCTRQSPAPERSDVDRLSRDAL